jgi:hypothetical protein
LVTLWCTVITASWLVAAAPAARADVIIDWNLAMTHYSELLPPPGMPPFAESRIYAMTHIAMFNALTGPRGGASADRRNLTAAAAQAAHDVLINQLPGGAADFDALLGAELAAIPGSPEKTRGIQAGAAAAAAMLAARDHDGAATALVPYIPGPNPGDYQFTPPFDGPPFNGFADVPKWGQVTPFVMKNGQQFRCGPPYRVTDLDYTFDLNEIKALGSFNSKDRTSDQTDLALFWYENSSFGWNRIARTLAAQRADSLLDHARLFASLNAALADSYISSLEAKYTYNFWRPITAIRRAASDGNDLTTADPGWEPLFLTPPVPDYPSAHACAGGAAAVVLAAFFGGDDQTFTFQSTMSFPFPGIQPRTYHHISDAAKENAISRMLVGIHFRAACMAGLEQGRDVGSWVVRHAPFAVSH